MFKKNWVMLGFVISFGIIGFAVFLYAFLRTPQPIHQAVLAIFAMVLLFGAFIYLAIGMFLVKISEEKISLFKHFSYKDLYWANCSKELSISSARTIILQCENKSYSINLMVFKDPDNVLNWVQKKLYETGISEKE